MLNDCEICGTKDWSLIYEGPIRAGAFGTRIENGFVSLCGYCGVARLDERFCIIPSAYENDDYRTTMDQGLEVEDFFSHADQIQIHNLSAFWPQCLRGQVVADIGCGAGSFLDHVSGLADKIIAVEPTERYHESLNHRGYKTYSYTLDAVKEFPEGVDLAVTFQVIEHVQNPCEFLNDIAALLKQDGILIIATPNRNDILMKLLPEEFPAFFYRTAHRWYFDSSSLCHCVESTGKLKVEFQRNLHSYGMSNMLSWMKDRRPTGNIRLPGINNVADQLWKGFLEASWQADTLYVLVRKSS